ncbi:MFS transporter [Listeria sp. FSL L7-1485]|uniref:MFS transporter n=3 Tax=Listeria immobilis TaxID=2713502 RepID=A0A7X0X695_9LIST|nr:MFS transporter [Listeria immobilis]MBC1482654.1 MFS transporter [Listeria immobilis]MBC1488324.1 MFS transporter [Listeria immobilis]MBC1507172.1 MFS transporter [Listeria immobilis]MBC1509916.1 MFS transporter [Listeria immobilis]MBC1516309.1 MFS transporter [Listeria immobilis]
MKFFSMKLMALLSVALMVNSAPAISANIPAITESFSGINPVYVGLLTTIPSLFLIVGVFFTNVVEFFLGRKYTILLGLVIVGVFGTLPAWYQGSFLVLFLSRCLLGLGIGLFNRLLIQMISSLYQSEIGKKAKALGLESACEGLGGIIMTISAGQLIRISWTSSFWVYGFAVVSLLFVAIFIPNQRVQPISDNEEAESRNPISKERKIRSIILGCILFCIVLLFINYNLQITPLLIEQGIGDATNGSNMIAAIGAGAFIAGNLFGRTYTYLKKWLLPIATFTAGLSIFFTNNSNSILFTLFCSLVLGFAFRNIMPYFMHILTTGGEQTAKFGATIVLVAYNLGATLAPYGSRLISVITGSTNAGSQIIVMGVLLCAISLITVIFHKYMTV